MAFPTTGILDSFGRADEGPPPSANWSYPITSGNDGLYVISNQVGADGAGNHDSYWGTSFGPDSECYVTVAAMPSDGSYVRLWLRIANPNNASLDGYMLSCIYHAAPGWDEWLLYRIDNGVPTQLGATAYLDFAVGYKIGLEVIDDDISAYLDDGGGWDLVATRADATYTAAGYIGLRVGNATFRGDDFGGGTIAAAGHTVAVGQASETDLAQAIAWAPKNRLAGQVAETDLAQAVTAGKTVAVGEASETDLAQSFSWGKTATIGQVVETDLAQAIEPAKARDIGQTVETDLAQAFISIKRVTLGQATETDLAQVITVAGVGEIIVSVGQTTESDLAQSVVPLKAWRMADVLAEESIPTLVEGFAGTSGLACGEEMPGIVTAKETRLGL